MCQQLTGHIIKQLFAAIRIQWAANNHWPNAATHETVREPLDMGSIITRQGYGVRDLVHNFDAKPAEIKALFANQLNPLRAGKLRDRMRLAGLPI